MQYLSKAYQYCELDAALLGQARGSYLIASCLDSGINPATLTGAIDVIVVRRRDEVCGDLGEKRCIYGYSPGTKASHTDSASLCHFNRTVTISIAALPSMSVSVNFKSFEPVKNE